MKIGMTDAAVCCTFFLHFYLKPRQYEGLWNKAGKNWLKPFPFCYFFSHSKLPSLDSAFHLLCEQRKLKKRTKDSFFLHFSIFSLKTICLTFPWIKICLELEIMVVFAVDSVGCHNCFVFRQHLWNHFKQ